MDARTTLIERRLVRGTPRFSVAHDAPCPCGSGRDAADCCATGGQLSPKAQTTLLPLPATGNSRNGCYAAGLNDCGRSISKEHYVSDAILTRLNESVGASPIDGLHVIGMPWQPAGVLQSLPPDALGARILCDRHNSALSPLDTKALFLFNSITEFEGRISPAMTGPSYLLRLFNGYDLERWLLKALCGYCSSGHAPRASRTPPPPSWLDILFKGKPFPPGCGLYAPSVAGQSFRSVNGVELSTVTMSDTVVGLTMAIGMFTFVLIMEPLFATAKLLNGVPHTFRPVEYFMFTASGFGASLYFHWDEPGDGASLSLAATEA